MSGPFARRRRAGSGLILLVALMAATGALAYGVQRATAGLSAQPASSTVEPSPPAVSPEVPTTPATASGTTRPRATPTTKPSASARPTATSTPEPATTTPAGPPPALARVLGPGDTGDRVRELQARLKALDWYDGDVTGRYAASTTAAVRGFQAKRGFTVDGVVDTRTLRRVESMSGEPTYGQLHNVVGFSGSTKEPLDKRCRTGRALCIDKTGSTVRWVVDGTVRSVMDVRFGASYSPTREGLFSVQSKSRDHVSRLYGSAMPFAMFFSGGQAVHYSSDFAARGYAGASHGCVNVRDREGIEKLFDQVRVGDKVVVYRA